MAFLSYNYAVSDRALEMCMNPVSIREAKAKFSALVEAARNGETITVTNQSRPVAVIAPFKGRRARRSAPVVRTSPL
jgi:prevent-host-death family protein